MLPLYLSIEGLYSYQEKQEIDFSKLTEAGLFGIFGAVGSGKSSILEAISFALYGDTERLNKTDKRAYNMLNLKSNQANIIFDFLNFKGDKYRFTATWKRRASRFEETSTIERLAYQWQDNHWIPLESADGSLVTELSYPNFRRTIIIPQGQFKEFLELKGKERSEMMKEIFHLNKFDLGPKVSILQQKNNQKLEHLKGALSGFELISAEILQEKEKELVEVKNELKEIKAEFDRVQQELQQLKEAQERQKELRKKKTELSELLTRKPKVEKQKNELEHYEKTVQIFREPLSAVQKLSQEKDTLTHKIDLLTTHRKKLSALIDELEEQLSINQVDYAQLDHYRLQSEDFRLLINIKQQEALLRLENVNLEKGKPIVLKTEREDLHLKKQIIEVEDSLEKRKAKKADTSQLMEIEAWYQAKDHLIQQVELQQKEKSSAGTAIEEIIQQLENEGYNRLNWEEKVEAQLQSMDQHLKELAFEETHLQVQVKLGEFAHNLNHGEPCPLCGALDHPQPMTAEQAQIDLKANEISKTSALSEQFRLFSVRTQLTRYAAALDNKQNELNKAEKHLTLLQSALEEHHQKFIWEGYSPDDKSLFGEQKNSIQQNEKAIKQEESNLKNLRLASQKKTEELLKYQQRLQEIASKIAQLNSRIAQSQEQLRVSQVEFYHTYSETDIVNLKQQIDTKIKDTEQAFFNLSQQLNLKKTELASVFGQYTSAKEQFGVVRETFASRQSEIAKLLRENNFQDQVEVQQVLLKNLPVSQYRQEIQDFFVRLQVLEQQVDQLNQTTAKDQFSFEVLEKATERFVSDKERYETQLSKTGGLEKELAHLAVQYAKKEKLVEEFEQISQRAQNLKTLDNLFKGNGFVNYMSSIHMERLCEIANLRFHRLTKNQLSLSVNENNEFEVIDYLNNGYRRSVKTLSGGQSFQASLCLALALAENIQALNKSDKNFFFIDEGFGTQDNESINTVFDTLQYLHQENRVVGIISHVDELKERMPRSITIVKDNEKGSQISGIQ